MREPDAIESYHAHVYYTAETKADAAALRAAVEARFEAVMGRWHDRPVGPHPMWSYQIAFDRARFAEIVPFLALNANGLTVFIHPNTGDALADHRDHAIWIGEQRTLDLTALAPDEAATDAGGNRS